jgi:uncharacterized protein YndB with AHSA1/START domain
MAARAADATLHLTRTFPAPREEVFRAWTEPELIKQWFGARHGRPASDVELDLRVGGSYRITMDPLFHRMIHAVGEFLEVEPPERLVYTFRWEGMRLDFGDMLVTVEFRDLGDATELALTHDRLGGVAARAFHRFGWTGSLHRLARLVKPVR